MNHQIQSYFPDNNNTQTGILNAFVILVQKKAGPY